MKQSDNNILLKKHLRFTYGDQKGQVEYLINNVFNYELNGLKKNGYFIDLACADGVKINNTLFLEKYLDWTGLLFESNPYFYESINKNRTSTHIPECIYDVAGEEVEFRIDNGMLGGIVSNETDNSLRTRGEELKYAEIIKVKTTTLEVEFEKNDVPKIIDYMSLDIEGAEYIALRNFPFNLYKFRCISIERPTKELDLFLDKNEYRQVKHLKNDVIYVHKDYLTQVNHEPLLKFAFTPRKKW